MKNLSKTKKITIAIVSTLLAILLLSVSAFLLNKTNEIVDTDSTDTHRNAFLETPAWSNPRK